MAFPAGSNINAFKPLFDMDESSSSSSSSSLSSSSSSSSEDNFTKKLSALVKETKGKNKTVMRYDRQIAEIEAKQKKLMVDINDLERQLKLLKKERQKAIQRINEDKMDELAKTAYKTGLARSLKMPRREAIELPK